MVAAFLLFIAALCPLAAEAPRVALDFSSEEPDEDFEDLLYITLGVELSNLGYSSIESRGIGTKSPYYLETKYTYRGRDADVTLSLYREDSRGDVLSSVDLLLSMSTSFDQEVAEGVRQLFDSADLEEKTDGSAGAEIGGLFKGPLTSGAPALRTTETVRFDTSAGAGAMVFLGEFSEYSHVGLFAEAQAGAIILKPEWSLSIDGRATFTWAFMAEGVEGGPVYFTTFGPNIQAGVGTTKKFKISGGLSAGAALITVANSGDSLTKVVPYADAGAQATFSLGRDIFLGGDIRFLAIFEPGLPILGVTAAVSINMEF